MTKKNLPNIPIYIGDWERDCNVLSLESEAAWMRIVFKMWTAGQKHSYRIPLSGLKNLWRCSLGDVYEILNELKRENISNISEDGQFVIFKEVCLQNKNTWVYFLLMETDTEEFIKIGITSCFKNLHGRYSYYGVSIKKILKKESYKNREAALSKEKEYHSKFAPFSFTPSLDFGGKTECFNLSILKKL